MTRSFSKLIAQLLALPVLLGIFGWEFGEPGVILQPYSLLVCISTARMGMKVVSES